jgi:hypothetical protein
MKDKKEIIEMSLKLKNSSGASTLYLQRESRTRYRVLRLETEGSSHWGISFTPEGGVKSLDENSDAMQGLGRCTSVQVGEVYLSGTEMRAGTREELEAALKKAQVAAFDPEEI